MVRTKATTPQTVPSSNQTTPPRPADYQDTDGSPDVMDFIINGTVAVITFIPVTLARFLNAFVERGGQGIRFLGALAFLMGVFAGADNFYQLFTDKALLPWFTESQWVGDLAVQNLPAPLQWVLDLWGGADVIGWSAVLLSTLSFAFLIALVTSLTTQFIQGKAVRGSSVAKAKADFEKWNEPTMPGKPDAAKKLDMATVSWRELKRTGTKQRGFLGFIALALWGFEIVSAFHAHNPLNYTGQVGLLVGCFFYAVLTIVAGETGYTLYMAAEEESRYG